MLFMGNRSFGLMILYTISLCSVVLCEATHHVREAYSVFDDIVVGRFNDIMCVRRLLFGPCF